MTKDVKKTRKLPWQKNCKKHALQIETKFTKIIASTDVCRRNMGLLL